MGATGSSNSGLCPDGGGGLPIGGAGAAMSVNLAWYLQSGPVRAIYTSCKVTETADGTYYCCCGFNGGYMGIQDVPNSYGFGNINRVIFSLWDQGGQPSVLYSGGGVSVERFGGEGTGVKTIDDGIGWNVGETVTCMVLFSSQGYNGIYAGYYLRGGAWKHIASIQVPGAGAFTGHYSFVEDFIRNGANTRRAAIFGPVWALTPDGSWAPANSCRFSASYNAAENGEAVNSEAAGVGMRSLESGGSTRGKWKLESVYPLAPGASGPPRYLPNFPAWF